MPSLWQSWYCRTFAAISASNIRGVSGRGASPGEVLVVVLVALVVAFFLIVSVVALPLLLLLPRKPPPGPPKPPPGPPKTKLNKKLNKNYAQTLILVTLILVKSNFYKKQKGSLSRDCRTGMGGN